jgi:hypothetical protein
MLALTAFFLGQHAEEWGTALLAQEPAALAKHGDLTTHVLSISDPLYIGVLYGSLLLSLAAWCCWVYCYRRPQVVEPIYARVEGWMRQVPVVRLVAPEKAGEIEENAKHQP